MEYASADNHNESYHRPEYQLLSKEALQGPVTALTIETCSVLGSQSQKIDDLEVCLIGRGPYVTVVPLSYIDDNDNSSANSTVGPGTSSSNIIPPKSRSINGCDDLYNHFAFGRRDVESGTVHGIHKVTCCMKNPFNLWTFHGGKKVSFATLDIHDKSTRTSTQTSTQKSTGTGTGTGTHTHTHIAPYSFTMTSFSIQDEKRCHLSLTDWIWDVRTIATPSTNKSDDQHHVNGIDFLSVMGMAQNTVEIWSLSSSSLTSITTRISSKTTSTSNSNNVVLDAVKLRKIICEKRCITYSLSFYGWKNEFYHPKGCLRGNDLQLAVAVGTVSNQVLVWNAIDDIDGEKILQQHKTFTTNSFHTIERGKKKQQPQEVLLTMVKKRLTHTLSGHLGVIYSCKFGNKGKFIVSTSDDRTVRLWRRNDGKDDNSESIDFTCHYETPSAVKEILNEKYEYSLQWTGFSHAARVWDSDYISIRRNDRTFHGIISSAEDASLKIWSVDDGSVVATLKGHSSQSIWKVCSTSKKIRGKRGERNTEFAISGANDGSINVWDTTFHISKTYEDSDTFQFGEAPKVLCGICFHPLERGRKILSATRDGEVNTLNLDTKEWIYHGNWTCSNEQGAEINTNFGSCIEMHPTLSLAIIGTTKGDIIIFSLLSAQKCAYSIPKYLAIQSIKWLNHCNFLAFHVKGIVLWWEIKVPEHDGDDVVLLSEFQCRLKKVFNMNTTRVGVPMSHYYDERENFLFIGDSRGNIAMFDCENSFNNVNCEQYPIDLLAFAHKKEHVTSIIPTNSRTCTGILSVGNDGNLNESTICKSGNDFKVQRSLSRPISNLTGVSYLWQSSSGLLIAGGYHGNQFVVVDVNTNNQLISFDSGGRNRRMIMWLDTERQNVSVSFTAAICVSNKKAPFEIITYSKNVEFSNFIPRVPKSLTIPFHGETVLDVALCNINGRNLLVSGSNDCSVKLSLITKSKISLVKNLPPHETCIRAVCISHHPGSLSAIIAVCGGKLISTFYRVDLNENDEIMVHFLCTTLLPSKPSIDHRINGVKAIPLSKKAEHAPSHLILAGDSDGGLHLTIVTEKVGQQRKVSSHFLTQDSRPILCVELLRLSEDFFVAFVGTTAGKVDMWILEKQADGVITYQESPLHSFDAHSMGTNCIGAALVDEEIFNDYMEVKVLICTGGDDQSLSLRVISISIPSPNRSRPISIVTLSSYEKAEACGSAIKGIDMVKDETFGYYRIYTAGYDQRMGIWTLHIGENNFIHLRLLSSTPIDIKDINTLGCCLEENKNDGTIVEHIIAGGEGLELTSLQGNVLKAAHALRRCNFLLITCGAGFSADSGLATYENMPEKYKELCNPLRLLDAQKEFQKFWFDFAKQYKETSPHKGYSVLESWCGNGQLENLCKSQNPWWIYTSNVDGHFGFFNCFHDKCCEIHGRATEFRCANKTGLSDGIKRDGSLWDEWNHRCTDFFSNEKCNNDKIDIFDESNELPFRCRESNIPLRPNVLMFHDTDENVLRDISHKRQLYQEWEAQIEAKVVKEHQNLVILELGAGLNVSAIRDESEEVFHDILSLINGCNNSNGSVILIRINPKDSGFNRKPDFEYPHECVISIADNAEHSLLMIDQILGVMKG